MVFRLAILNEKRGRVIDMFEPFFLLQVVLSFVIGGAVIGTMTVLAQYLPQKTAGIILSLPITIGISLFFLWFVSPQDEFISSFDIIPMGVSIVMSFLVIYIYVAQLFKKRSISIFVSLSSIYVSWLLFVISTVSLGKPTLLSSFLAFFFITACSQWALFRLPSEPDQGHSHTPSAKEIMVRMVLAGSVVALSLLTAKAASPFWGIFVGVTLPSVYPSYLAMLHYAHGPGFLIKVLRLMPTGSTTYIVYAFVVREMYPLLGPWMGTLIAYASTVVYMYLLSKITIAVGHAFHTSGSPILKAVQKNRS